MKKPINKGWGLGIIILIVILGVIGFNGNNEPSNQTTPAATTTVEPSANPTSVPSLAPAASDPATSEGWDSSLKRMAISDATPTEKADAIEKLAHAYIPSEVELLDFNSSIVEEYTSQNYLANLEDAEYMLTNIFKAVVVQHNHKDGEPIKDFAVFFNQNTKNIYTGAEAAESDSIKSNEAKMNETLKKITKNNS